MSLLLRLLEGFQAHPFLKGRLALKGGTALNLFEFNVPRLSVDIDLNYIGAIDLEKMQAERPKIEQALKAVCQRESSWPSWPDTACGIFSTVTGYSAKRISIQAVSVQALWPTAA